MKLSVLLTCILSVNLMASVYSQNARFDMDIRDQSVRDILKSIEKESEFRFFYNDEFTDLNRKLTFSTTDQSIDGLMALVLENTEVSYKVLDNNFIVITPKSLIQQSQIKGIISDDKGNPLPGVSISIKGTTRGTITDTNGNFTIESIDSQSILVVSFIGYKKQEVIIGNMVEIDITLQEEITGLDEVVVIGYGTQSRATLTTSVTKLDTKVLANVPFANAASALQGNVSGVLVQSISGQPGAAPRIIIRGGTSINNPNGAAPLYIIDGVIRSNMNDISSEDIESIQVLKDAASTTIYGARGSNGVVLITTKSGKAGETQITYNYDLTFSQVAKTIEMASARDYLYYGRLGIMIAGRRNPAIIATLTGNMPYGTGNDLTTNTGFTTQYLTPENEYKLNEGWESMPDPIDPTKTIIFKGTDFQDLIFHTGVSHNHHLAVTGGTDKATFSAGIGYLTNEGIAITTGYDRFSANLNGELKVRENLSFFGRSMYTNSINKQVYGINNIFTRALGLAPTAKYTFEDGSLAPGRDRANGNPAYFLGLDKTDNSNETLTLSVGGNWGILPGLSFDPQISIFKTASDGYTFLPSYLNGANSWNTTRSASASYSKSMQTQADAIFNYKKSFTGSNNLDITAGFSYFGRNSLSLSAAGQGAATDLIPTLNAISTMTSMNGSTSENMILGYFGRVNYNYKQKYLVSLNARYDGASQLGASNRWGLFPGVSLGWNLHEEEFWSALPENLLRLKLRGSYGVTGNISGLGDYQAQGAYAVGNKYETSAIENTVIPNPDLRWEQSRTLDAGADIGILNGRFDIILDIYRRVTDDLLTSLTLPQSTGFTSIFTNFGSLENKGFEIELGAQIMPAESDLQWRVTFNASNTSHKILKLPYNGIKNNRVGGNLVWDPELGAYDWKGGLQEGGKMGDWYAWEQTGIYSTDEEALSAPVNVNVTTVNKTRYGGDVKYQDSDGNDTLDARDLVYMGNSYPKWTGGISSSISYKGFELFVRMDYMTGHTIHNYTKVFLAGLWNQWLNFPQEYITNSWKEQGDIATWPAVYNTGNFNWGRTGSNDPSVTVNSTFWEKGDFLCLREVTLSYNLPSAILRKVKIDNLRLNITGNNLHYFTKYSGMSPEEGGTDNGRYPLPRNVIFGAVVSF